MKKFGFTLAEILVTMGIIGVVAAMTAPVLMTNVKNQSYATKLRTTVNDLENAFSMAIAAEKAEDLTGTSLWNIGETSTVRNRNTFTNNLSRYLKFNTVAGNGHDFYPAASPLRSMNADGTPGVNAFYSANDIPFRLKNGAIIFYEYGGGQSATIGIDVNGLDGPNVLGRDVHNFLLMEDATINPNFAWTTRLVNNNYQFDY